MGETASTPWNIENTPILRIVYHAAAHKHVPMMEYNRYFMTIPEASRLVIQAGAIAEGGEVFVLDMGEPVKIVDLAKNMIKLSGYINYIFFL